MNLSEKPCRIVVTGFHDRCLFSVHSYHFGVVIKIKIITTGGTIDKICFDRKSEFMVGDPEITNVLKGANVTLEYEVLPLLRKDSLDLTGAMQPAKFTETDAIFNIASSVIAVQLLPDGAYIAMNGRIFNPDKVRKNVPLNRFEEAEDDNSV